MTKLLVLSALLALTATADARPSWTINAGACVPTDVDVAAQGTHYWTVTGGMRVKHKGSDTQDINLICPITQIDQTNGMPNTLVLYHGNTGQTTNPNSSVSAQLRSVARWTGAYMEGTSNVCGTSSAHDIMTLWGNGWAYSYCKFQPLDFDHYIYWVQLTIHRTDPTTQFPEADAVELLTTTWSQSSAGGSGSCTTQDCKPL